MSRFAPELQRVSPTLVTARPKIQEEIRISKLVIQEEIGFVGQNIYPCYCLYYSLGPSLVIQN